MIGARGQVDRAGLAPLPAAPFLVDDKHLRRVGKDCMISFDASLYSVPARRVRAGQTVELRVTLDTVAIHALDGALLAAHPRAAQRGTWVVDAQHWAGLPDGGGRATILELPRRDRPPMTDRDQPAALASLLTGRRAFAVAVAHRPLADYAALETRTARTEVAR